MTRAGVLAAVLGSLLVFLGVFGFMGRCAVPGAPCPSPSLNEILAYGGLAVLLTGVTLLTWAGWRGRVAGSALAAIASVPATWFIYEVVRQEGCPLLANPIAAQACLTAYGEMTAPVISVSVAGASLLIGWWRRRAGDARATSTTAD
jgi:hypothetical protein